MNPHSSLPTTTNHHPSVRNSRFFTGWIMLGIAAAAQYLSAPGQSYSVAAFKDPMQNDLGISHTDQIRRDASTQVGDVGNDVPPEIRRSRISMQKNDRLALTFVYVAHQAAQYRDLFLGVAFVRRCHGSDVDR